jgi:hypothetical protein
MTEQMEMYEVKDRLGNGEDPLDLAIEKWKRLRAWIDENKKEWTDESDIEYNADTCALCIVNENTLCENCLIGKYDVECGDVNSTWRRFSDLVDEVEWVCDTTLDGVLNAADEMIAMLERIKKEVENDRN